MTFPAARLFGAIARAGMTVPVVATSGAHLGTSWQAGFVRPDVEQFGGALAAADAAIEYQTVDAPQLALGDLVTVNGDPYRVIDVPRAEGDGFFSRAAVGRV